VNANKIPSNKFPLDVHDHDRVQVRAGGFVVTINTRGISDIEGPEQLLEILQNSDDADGDVFGVIVGITTMLSDGIFK